ncbi:MAG: porin family protein [Bacteroidia bacterium]|nr:porin family protein [Bacteroidia bacterium]
MSRSSHYSKFFSLIVLLFLAVGSKGIAQDFLKVSVKGGINLATLFGDTYSNLGPRTGLVLGLAGELPYKDNWLFQAEIFYAQEGARNPNYDFSSFSDVVYDQKLIYDFVNVPLLIKYELKDQLTLLFGPQIGFRISAKESRKIKAGTPAPSDTSAGTRDLSNRIKVVYPSLVAGAEYALTEQLKAQARVGFSMFDIVKRNAGDSEGTYPLILQIGISYHIFQVDL